MFSWSTVFNIMGDVLDRKSCHMEIHTLSAVQTVSYHMRASKKTPLQYFKRESVLHSPVDPLLMGNMKRAYSKYKAKLQAKKDIKKVSPASMAVPNTSMQSKRKAKDELDREQKKLRLEHVKK